MGYGKGDAHRNDELLIAHVWGFAETESGQLTPTARGCFSEGFCLLARTRGEGQAALRSAELLVLCSPLCTMLLTDILRIHPHTAIRYTAIRYAAAS